MDLSRYIDRVYSYLFIFDRFIHIWGKGNEKCAYNIPP